MSVDRFRIHSSAALVSYKYTHPLTNSILHENQKEHLFSTETSLSHRLTLHRFLDVLLTLHRIDALNDSHAHTITNAMIASVWSTHVVFETRWPQCEWLAQPCRCVQRSYSLIASSVFFFRLVCWKCSAIKRVVVIGNEQDGTMWTGRKTFVSVVLEAL